MKSREMVSNLKEHTQKVTKIKFVDNDTKLISSSRDRALLCTNLTYRMGLENREAYIRIDPANGR